MSNLYLYRSISLQPLQVVALIMVSCYFLFLISFLFFGEERAKSILGVHERGQGIQATKGVIMENVERVEFNQGIRKWNLIAQSLRYSDLTGTAFLKSPVISVFNKENIKPTIIKSKSAKVVTQSDAVKTAYLEGDVRLEGENGVVVESPSAEYLSSEMKVIFPQHASIFGPGYRVEGDNLVVQTETNMLDFGSNVNSYFESNGHSSKMPNLKGF